MGTKDTGNSMVWADVGAFVVALCGMASGASWSGTASAEGDADEDAGESAGGSAAEAPVAGIETGAGHGKGTKPTSTSILPTAGTTATLANPSSTAPPCSAADAMDGGSTATAGLDAAGS